MSYRYRIIHVDAARTHEIRRFNFNFVDADRNTCNSGAGWNACTDLADLETRLEANNPGLNSIPRNILMLTGDPSSISDFNTFGFSNLVSLQSFSVGDRLYIDRWDNSHSYIEITSIGSNYDSMGLSYRCADGTAYVSINISLGHTSPWTSICSLPLCSSLDNWTQASQAGVQQLNCFMNTTTKLAGGSMSMSNSGFTLEVAKKFWSTAKPLDGDNPYAEAGYTGLGGGDPDNQNWDDESDTVTDDPLPTIGAVSSGMISLFSPTDIQIQNLADLLFSYNFFDWLQKNLQNLEELIVSFAMVPFAVSTGSSPSVTFLGFDISQFTHPVNLRKCTAQYYEFPMGSIAFDGSDGRIHTTDSVFDYSPFSTLGIYLPFIGFQELDIDEVRGTILSLKYKIDVLSGTCVAIITVTDTQGSRDIYQFSGNCLTQLPLGSTDLSGIVQGSISIATAAASAGSSAAVASAGEALSAEKQAAGKLSEAGADLQNKQRGAMVSNSAGNLAGATANGMMGMKPNYKHSGSIGASGSMLAVKQPYIFLKTPREAVPERYENYCGLPSNITTKLSACKGYTVVEDIRLNGLVATSPEVEEIYQLLKSGVII